MNNKDYYFYINWEDDKRNLYRIGILARIDDIYYMKTQQIGGEKERDASSHGYNGIPGFVNGNLYKSEKELFDFFKERVYLEKNDQTDIMEELNKTGGKTLRDSFSLEEMPERLKENCKEVLQQLAQQQDKRDKEEQEK